MSNSPTAGFRLPQVENDPDCVMVELTTEEQSILATALQTLHNAFIADDYGRCLNSCIEVLFLDPSNDEAATTLASILREMENAIQADAHADPAELFTLFQQTRQMPHHEAAEASKLLELLANALPARAEIHTEAAQRALALGRPMDAMRSLAYAHALSRSGESACSWGIAWITTGNPRYGIPCLRLAEQLNPSSLETKEILAESCIEHRRFGEAVEVAGRMIALPDGLAPGLRIVSQSLSACSRDEEAVALYEKALAVRPDSADMTLEYGAFLSKCEKWEAARATFLKAAELKPRLEACIGAGLVLIRAGQQERAREMLMLLIERGVGGDRLHSFLIWLIEHIPSVSIEEQQAERRRWDEMHAGPVRFPPPVHPAPRPANEPLRVGLVSGEFHKCSAVFGYSALLSHRSPNTKVYCYSNTRRLDDMSDWIRSKADVWRDILALDDDAAAALVRQDEIDVLIDISGHSWMQNRLMMFARKPAPIQVTGWGFASGVGLSAVDYLISDSILIPPDQAHLFNEEIFYLPSVIGYSCPEDSPPVGPLPARTKGHVTFGSFSSVEKLSDELLDSWAAIMHGVQGSRLLLKYNGYGDSDVRAAVSQRFAQRGIDPERLTMKGATPWFKHMQAYGEIDIALDTYPHSGGITTMDALWMGVPVITRCGSHRPSRNGASLLTSCGLPEWITHSHDEYVGLAIKRAGDLAGLMAVRAELRTQVLDSVMAPPNYARAIEAGLREMNERRRSGAGRRG